MIKSFIDFSDKIEGTAMMLLYILLILVGLSTSIVGDETSDFQNNSKSKFFFLNYNIK